jgi:hypothetical protein
MFSPKKLFKILRQFLFLTLVLFPLTYIGIQIKEGSFRHGDEFFVLNMEAALLIAAGFALLLAIWNAFEFEKFKNIDHNQYLSAQQKYLVKLGEKLSSDELLTIFQGNLLLSKRWTLLDHNESQIRLSFRFYLNNRDVFTVSKDSFGWTMESKPAKKVWFIDLARNYGHIVNITGEILKTNLHGKN